MGLGTSGLGLAELMAQATPPAAWRGGHGPQLITLPSGRRLVGRRVTAADLSGGPEIDRVRQAQYPGDLVSTELKTWLLAEVCRAGFIYPRVAPDGVEPGLDEIAFEDIGAADVAVFCEWALRPG